MEATTTAPGPASAPGEATPASPRAAAWITGACEILLAAMALLVTASVLVRATAGIGWSFTEELSGFLLVAISFLGLPAAQREGAIFRVDTLFDRLPLRWRTGLALLWDAIALLFTLLLAFQLGLHTYSSYTKGVASTDATGTPLWIPQLFMPLGLLLLSLALAAGLRRTWGAARGAGEPRP